MDDSMNFNEIFRKNVTCDNIKSHKISGLHSLSLSLSLWKAQFQKKTELDQIDLPQRF